MRKGENTALGNVYFDFVLRLGLEILYLFKMLKITIIYIYIYIYI